MFAVAAATPFLFSAGTFAAASALILTMSGTFRAKHQEGLPPTTLKHEISEGARWLWNHRLLRTLALSIAVMNVTLFSVLSILVLVAQERLGLDSVGYGLLVSCIAVGGIFGSLISERVTGWLGRGTALRVGLVIEASTHLLIALVPNTIVVGSVLVVFGVHAIVWSVISVSLRQEIVPERLLGRVSSAYMVFAAGSVSIGALLGGVLARSFGLTAPFWFAFMLVAALTFVVWPILNNETTNEARRNESLHR